LLGSKDEEAAAVFPAIVTVAGSQHFFNANEITEDQIYVVPEAGVIDQCHSPKSNIAVQNDGQLLHR